MSGKKEINLRNVTYGNSPNIHYGTKNIHYGTRQEDQRRIEFLEAVIGQDMIQIKKFLIAHPDIFDSDYKVNTFIFACEENKLSAGECLWQCWKTDLIPSLVNNGRLNEKLSEVVCSFSQCEDIDHLILSNKDILKNSHSVQRYILLNTITRGKEEVFKEAVMSGANPYLPAEDDQLLIDKARVKGFKGLEEYKDLCTAVRARNMVMLQAMLLRGDDTNKWDENKCYMSGDDPDENAGDEDCNTPLHLAALYGNTEAAQLLIKQGAAVNSNSRWADTPLHYAARRGHTETVEFLLRCRANLNALNLGKETALHQATRQGHIEIVRKLLEVGANVNAVDTRGMSPLDSAIRRNKEDIILLLKQHGAIRRDEMGDLYDLF